MTAETQSQKAKRGFTLTEIAIVLGIIGLILGAIWVAAAAVYNNMRIQTASTQLLQITQALRSMYATSQTADTGADMSGSTPNTTYIKAGIFPTSALNNGVPATATNALNPWNGNIYIQTATSPGSTTANNSFVVWFDAIPTQGCITLLTANTGQNRDPGMFSAGGGASGSLPAQVTLTAGTPFAPSTAEGVCNAAGVGNAAAFWFTLRADV